MLVSAQTISGAVKGEISEVLKQWNTACKAGN
jgi:hypothetical protein